VYARMWQEDDCAFWTVITSKKTIVGIISVTIRENYAKLWSSNRHTSVAYRGFLGALWRPYQRMVSCAWFTCNFFNINLWHTFFTEMDTYLYLISKNYIQNRFDWRNEILPKMLHSLMGTLHTTGVYCNSIFGKH
jgi:hypothetical protein